MQITSDDIAMAMQGALDSLPEKSSVYSMCVSTSLDSSNLLTRSGNVHPLGKSSYDHESLDALNDLIAAD